jgi:hypothetical protein
MLWRGGATARVIQRCCGGLCLSCAARKLNKKGVPKATQHDYVASKGELTGGESKFSPLQSSPSEKRYDIGKSKKQQYDYRSSCEQQATHCTIKKFKMAILSCHRRPSARRTSIVHFRVAGMRANLTFDK